MTTIWNVEVPLPVWATWGLLVAALVPLAWVVSRAVAFVLERASSRTSFEWDQAITVSLRPYLFPTTLLVAAHLFLTAVPLAGRAASITDRAIGLGYTLLAVIAIVRTLLFLLRRALWHSERLAPVAPPLLRVGRVALVAIGLLVVLDTAGMDLAPVLATLGVGSIAVALALSPSLSNFFAGLYLLADRPLKPGDYVALDSGEEGYVERIGWRATRIRKLQNNMVIVPNEKLAGSVITNYHQPDPRMALLITISVSYDSDSRFVEALLVRVAKEAASEVKGLLTDPEPFVRFIPGFGNSSLDFTLIVQVQEFVDQYLAQHELRHRIFETFRKEGIEIPFPQRMIHLREAGENA
jgi:small-conductance mechanosensitive channel